MKKLFTIVALSLLSLLTLLSFWEQNKQNLFVATEQFIPFARSMANSPLQQSHRSLSKRFARKSKWKKVRKLYELHILHAKPAGKHRIPKIIHYIAQNDPPHLESWSQLHPSYQIVVWTPKKIASLKMRNRTRFNEAQTPEEKTALLRYEILYRYGGIIVPPNMTPLRSFDALNHLCDFFVGLKPLEKNALSPRISGDVIAAAPRHPIIKMCLSEEITLTRAFLKEAKNQTYKNVALPSSYFSPYIDEERGVPQEAYLTHK